MGIGNVDDCAILSNHTHDARLTRQIVQLGVDYVDLYLIHSPRLAQPDIPTAWAEMEAIKRAGLAK